MVFGSDRHVLDAATGNRLIGRRLAEVFAGKRRAFAVARLSLGAELTLTAAYVQGRNLSDLSLLRNAGVYPESHASEFAQKYLGSLDCGLVGVWGAPGEQHLLKPCHEQIEARAVEPYYFDKPWTLQLANKTVLVVHPFAEIQSQYGKPLWTRPVLPRFKLVTVRAYMTFGDGPHASWSETLREMEAKIARVDFDVALLGCGSYGVPLTHFIVNRLKRPAIYVGGALQILFGIKGARWAARPEFQRVFNEYWVYPETPSYAPTIENAAYW